VAKKSAKKMPPGKSFEDIMISSGPEDMSKEERNRLLSIDIKKGIKEVSMSLEDFHGLFYQLWEMGYPRITFSVPTAAVGFDKVGNHVDFMFNPAVWEKLDLYTRSFVVSHECLHVMLNHGIRIKDCLHPSLANKALDVVVNHMLVSKFGFNRASLDFSCLTEGYTDKDGNSVPFKNDRGEDIILCWIDTVFGKEATKVSRNKPFEYYYHLLEKNVEEILGKLILKSLGGSLGKKDGDGAAGQELGGYILDDHSQLSDFGDPEIQDKISEYLNNGLGEDEKEDLQKRLCKTEEGNASETMSKKQAKSEPGGREAGSLAGKLVYDPEARRVQKKKKWETIIKKWARKYLTEESNSDQWARQNRRHSGLHTDLLLPSEATNESKEDEKIDVFFFQDTSGSCVHLLERFFRAALSLPDEKFNVRGFAFDTEVYDVDFKKPEIRGGGGTRFDIMESRIQQELKNGKIQRYPDAVFVITDGYGCNVIPEKAEKWNWFLTEGGSRNNIPKKSRIFDLADFE